VLIQYFDHQLKAASVLQNNQILHLWPFMINAFLQLTVKSEYSVRYFRDLQKACNGTCASICRTLCNSSRGNWSATLGNCGEAGHKPKRTKVTPSPSRLHTSTTSSCCSPLLDITTIFFFFFSWHWWSIRCNGAVTDLKYGMYNSFWK